MSGVWRHLRTFVAVVFVIGTLCLPLASSSAVTPVTTTTTVGTEGGGSGGNVVLQLVGYVKDSVVRSIDGTKEMWGNYGRCKEIRAKQKLHRESLQQHWEMTMPGMSQKEMKQRLQKEQGGISYDEFVFLRKGKEDRGKLMNMMFLMVGAPKYLPYAIMFYPDILPSPFATSPTADDATESLLEKKSRERAHAVVNTLIELEKSAKVIPALAKLNFFGRNKQQRQLVTMGNVGSAVSSIMTDPKASGSQGAQVVLDALDREIFFDEEPSRADTRLVSAPKPIIQGLNDAIDGPQFAASFLPNFMKRGKIITHLQKITEADDFLVKEKIDLSTLSSARLLDACNDRLIGGPGRTDEEMRELLSDWLDMAVIKPSERVEQTGQYYNGNVARTALIAYHAVEGARDERASSYLPRLLFQGQQQQQQPEPDEQTEHSEYSVPLPFFPRRKNKDTQTK